jgi:hypothetical protein
MSQLRPVTHWHGATVSTLLGVLALLGVLMLAVARVEAQTTSGAFLPQLIVSSTVPTNGDLNPYGVAFVPANFATGGAIRAGDVLVSNFNNTNNLQGTGTTIIKLRPDEKIAPSGNASVFFQGTGLGLTTALGVLRRGFVLVGNVPTTDGKIGTIKPGSLLFLDRNGNQVSPSPYTNQLDGPWDLTIDDQFDHARVFVSNVLNGTVTRLDLTVGGNIVTVNKATVIASGYTVQPNDAALILGPAGLAYDPTADVLYVASTADNKIFGVARAGTRASANGAGKVVFKDKHLRGPLALAFAPNGHLLTSNGDAVNADATEPSEIIEFTNTGEFVSQFNVDASQGGAFGLAVSNAVQAVAGAGASVASLAFVDDVSNSIVVLGQNTAQQE